MDEENPKACTREFQKELHERIAHAIMSAVENERDDEWFDQTALEDMEQTVEGMDTDDLTDYAEIMLEYKHGKETWQGCRIPTKEERQTS